MYSESFEDVSHLTADSIYNDGLCELQTFSNGSTAKDSMELVLLRNPDVKELVTCEIESEAQVSSDTEAEILTRQIYLSPINIGYFSLYRYATYWDITIIAGSCLCSIASGAALPLMTILFGQLSGVYQGYFSGLLSRSEFDKALTQYVLYYVYLAIGEFFTIYLSMVGFLYTGEHITRKIRERYLAACLSQNIGFFDVLGAGELTTRITVYTNLIQDGISEKVGLTLAAFASFVAAFVIGFLKYWKLTLILVSSVVAATLVMVITSKFIVKYTKKSLEAYAFGGSVAEEVISSICNATAFGTQEKFAQKYDKYLAQAERWGFKVKLTFSVIIGTISLVMYLSYGLAFWQGVYFLVNGETDFSSILTIILAIMIGALSLANVAPSMQSFTIAASAGTSIFSIIDRESPLDPFSDTGVKLDQTEGTIEFKKVKHTYPLRPFIPALYDFSLKIPAGKRVALVGASGSGKSTVVDLIQRFYEPVQGQILLDGHDIRNLNLKWLRQQMSIVSQESTLFGMTVFENIKQGLIGTRFENDSEEEKRELVIEAAKKANAHDFIACLPKSYDTFIGKRLLSGGQKQRISIARAIVGNPKILLLDEATSSLDTESEGKVQAALKTASVGRTTLTIAHRLSTIMDADVIVVMAQGCIIEQGSHHELIQKRQAYYQLIKAQKILQINTLDSQNQFAATSVEDTPSSQMFAARVLQDIEKPLSKPLGSTDEMESVNIENMGERNSILDLRNEPEEVPEKKYSMWSLIKVIAVFNRNEWKLMLLGLFFCIICGAGNPIQTLFFAEQVTLLSFPILPWTVDFITGAVDYWCLMYLMLALVQFVAFLIQGASFAYCSERLVRRVRNEAFRVLLRQDMSFFDENSAGALVSFLSTETAQMAGLSGTTLGTILTMLTTLVAALTLAFIFGWKLALVTASTIPFLLLSGFLQFWILANFQVRAKKAFEASAGYACEAISAVRTIASLTLEVDVLRYYSAALVAQSKNNLRSALRSTAVYALSQSFIFFSLALGFWYGGTLIANKEYNIFQVFVCFPAIIFGAQSAGTIFSFAPDMSKAQEATRRLKVLFDRQPVVDPRSDRGNNVETLHGSIEFRDVHFKYPTRPEQPVLQNLNFHIAPGKFAALVGASGCGKSTVIALLSRFYDPLSGGVYVDGQDIRSLNINNYRSFIALVSQEPSLYQGTIRENLLLGITKEDSETLDSSIEQACKEANIYDFIMSLPDGFSTNIGSKGNLLSGGQKQRLAIARALLRDPKILLLDEATSALDSESEQLVQAALDAAAQGRTTIAIAHRLSTIQNADIIYVLDKGGIVEEGTHAYLMAKGGRYSELVSLQNLGHEK